MALTQVSTGGIKDGQVHTADLADGQVTVGKLHADALDRTYTLGADGSNHYTFTGEGLTGAVNDPTLYLTRGKTYRFVNGNSAGAHPFRIQTTVNGSAGTEYNTGVTNNGGAGGSTIIFEVPHAAPDVLYYQCTSHGSMGGILYVTGALADGTVTTAKLADDAVTDAKLANSINSAIAANTAKPSITINNNADNRVITGSGTANTLNGESNVIVDSSGRMLLGHTAVGAKGAASPLQIQTANSGAFALTIKNRTSNNDYSFIGFTDDDASEDLAQIGVQRTAADTGDLFFYTNGGSSGSNERVRIDSSGHVGIGTTTPDQLGAGSDSTILAVIESSGTRRGQLLLGDNQNVDTGGIGDIHFVGKYQNSGHKDMACIKAQAAGSTSGQRGAVLIFETKTDGTAAIAERMRIDSSGRVGIGTTSSNETLTIINSANHSTSPCYIKANGSNNVRVLGLQSLRAATSGGIAGSFIEFFKANGSAIGSVTGENSISYNTTSDYRLKENVVAISDGITRLKTLKPSRFNWIVNPSTTVDGFLAHEVTAVPEAVTGTKDEVDENNEPVYQGIDQSKLVPLLTAALQEAIAKIEVLETKVAALEAA